MTKIKITYLEMIELERMLNGSSEDYSIATSNIDNLKLDPVYSYLLSKNIKSGCRTTFLKDLSFNINKLELLTFDNIYQMIKSKPKLIQDEILRDYFYYSVKKLIEKSMDCLCLPIDDMSIKIKWPLCKK